MMKASYFFHFEKLSLIKITFLTLFLSWKSYFWLFEIQALFPDKIADNYWRYFDFVEGYVEIIKYP